MILDNLQPAIGNTKNVEGVGRGQESGTGKTAGKGNKGQKAGSGYNVKRGSEDGQQPLARRLPKIGFTSRTIKPCSINADRITQISTLDGITLDSIKSVYKLSKSVEKVKLIGTTAKNLIVKIRGENVTTTGK